MFQGDPALALELWQRAADIDQMYLGTCALAAGYADQLDIMWDTYRRAIRWGTEHGSLSDLAFTHYVAGEFSEDDAETHFGEAISLAQRAGANFVEGVARVGLSSRHARAGRDEAALRGFDEVIRYWRGTGNWTQQWTTLRNLAVLLERRGDPDTAALIVASASVAAEASADLRAIGGDDVPAVEPVGRGEAVRTALLAIERQLAH
jgi:tetratricopeptide (TPR) repeat protein